MKDKILYTKQYGMFSEILLDEQIPTMPIQQFDEFFFNPKGLVGVLSKDDVTIGKVWTWPIKLYSINKPTIDWRDAVLKVLIDFQVKRLKLTCDPDADFVRKCNSMRIEVCQAEY